MPFNFRTRWVQAGWFTFMGIFMGLTPQGHSPTLWGWLGVRRLALHDFMNEPMKAGVIDLLS
jgi:hypothetical protein